MCIMSIMIMETGAIGGDMVSTEDQYAEIPYRTAIFNRPVLITVLGRMAQCLKCGGFSTQWATCPHLSQQHPALYGRWYPGSRFWALVGRVQWNGWDPSGARHARYWGQNRRPRDSKKRNMVAVGRKAFGMVESSKKWCQDLYQKKKWHLGLLISNV